MKAVSVLELRFVLTFMWDVKRANLFLKLYNTKRSARPERNISLTSSRYDSRFLCALSSLSKYVSSLRTTALSKGYPLFCAETTWP